MNYYKDLYEKKSKEMSEYEIRKISNILTIDGWSNFLKKVQILIKLLTDSEVLYALFYIGFAILALSSHYFYFSFHLIEFIKTQPVLRQVLRSVYNPRVQLIFIFAFFMVLEYFYTLIIFYVFHDIMPDDSCDSVFSCLATVYSETFTVSQFILIFLVIGEFRKFHWKI